jgi:hypothetical protein
VWVSNVMGLIEALDVAARRVGGALKGSGGSVRALSSHPGGLPLIASAGLDRHLRIHDTGSRKWVGGRAL